MSIRESPYIFRASEAELVAESDTLKVKEAHMNDGVIVRYQERSPGRRSGRRMVRDGPHVLGGVPVEYFITAYS